MKTKIQTAGVFFLCLLSTTTARAQQLKTSGVNSSGSAVGANGTAGLFVLGQAAAGRFESWGTIPLNRSGSGFAYSSLDAELGSTAPAAESAASLEKSHKRTADATGVAPAQTEVDPTFTFRDQYAFPNPSRGREGVTIRVQAGLADEADIRVYSLTGSLVHQGATRSVRALDDGNGKGLQYTYDYFWDTGAAGSGVYFYQVRARKAGFPDIQKSSKFAVLK